jgi:hypothetical protein
MPLHAFGERKYFGSGFGSKMADNEHAEPSLGQAEVLRVQAAVGPPIPELFQAPEDGSQVPSGVRRQESRHVLDENPAGSECSEDAVELPPQTAASTFKARSATRNGNILAGESPANKVDWLKLTSRLSHVVIDRHVWPVPPEHLLAPFV